MLALSSIVRYSCLSSILITHAHLLVHRLQQYFQLVGSITGMHEAHADLTRIFQIDANATDGLSCLSAFLHFSSAATLTTFILSRISCLKTKTMWTCRVISWKPQYAASATTWPKMLSSPNVTIFSIDNAFSSMLMQAIKKRYVILLSSSFFLHALT